MQSHLTRHVIRQILGSEPLTHLQCSSQVLLRRGHRRSIGSGLQKNATRSMFGLSTKAPKGPRPTDLDPGYLQLIQLNNMLAVKARPPPTPAITKAIMDLIRHKCTRQEYLDELQAQHAIVAFKYLQQNKSLEELSTSDLRMILLSLGSAEGQEQKRGGELARLVYEERRARETPEYSEQEEFRKDFDHYVRILTVSGASGTARDLVEKHVDENEDRRTNIWLWTTLLKGFAKERKDEEVLQTIDLMKSKGIPFNAEAHRGLVLGCIKQDNLASTKRWYSYPLDVREAPDTRTRSAALRMSIRHKDINWAQELSTEIMKKTPTKGEWDSIFQWGAAKGKGVDEIEKMMTVMVQRNEKAGNDMRPDITTINGLIDLANTMNDPYTAERYLSLAHKLNIALNAQTHLLQLDYRIKVGDLAGARKAYEEVQAFEVKNQDVPFVNRLIFAFCKTREPEHDAIMSLVEDLTERKVRFEPDTVSALSMHHLKRNELHEVIDLLQTHVFHYSLNERASIRDTFVNFCLDRSNNTAIAWDAYTILRQLFDETDRSIRTKMMHEFFDRNRSDMAIHVFGHMRQSPLQEKRPTATTYTQCLEGIARQADLASLETVHNMLKLDSEVEPDTRLYNALMLAYSACKLPQQSLEFWDDIVFSREGPTYNSICIALRACELMAFGEKRARDIWRRLQKFEIDVTKEIYAAYVAALVSHKLVEESMELLDKMEAGIGSPPDALTLGIFYNACNGGAAKDDVEAWIKDKHPGLWEELERIGRAQPKGGHGQFKIDRYIPA